MKIFLFDQPYSGNFRTGKEEFDLDVSYQTEKFFLVSYNLNLSDNEKTGDLQCWVSLINNSSASYKTQTYN